MLGTKVMKKGKIGVGLIGLGVVGGQVARVLMEKAEELSSLIDCPLVLSRLKILESDIPKAKAMGIRSEVVTLDEAEFFASQDVDIVVELMGGETPAYDYLKRTLANGKYAVTANKEVIAKHRVELLSLAEKHGVKLRYEASVGSGIPLITPFQYGFVANEIKGIYAIINGTTNYILTHMAKEGLDFASALQQAQKLGYAEANPENDVEGKDSTYKIAILASLAFKTQVLPQDIYREGISQLHVRDFQYARELGFEVKLLAIAKRSNDSIEVRVHPVLISEDDFLAKVDGVYNAVLVEGDLVGKVFFLGEGAGGPPASSAIVSDIVSAAQDIIIGMDNKDRHSLKKHKMKPISDIETCYYFRLLITDQPGVLAHISQILDDSLITTSSVIQRVIESSTQTAEMVIVTHTIREEIMQQALKELSLLEGVKEIGSFLRVETSQKQA